MSRIDIKSETLAGGVCLVKPSGKLDVFSFVELKTYFEELCAREARPMVVVDLSAVDYIASSGWSVLLSRRQSIRRQGGDLAICGLGVNLKRVYDTMKIDKMLPLAADTAAAAGMLKAPEAA